MLGVGHRHLGNAQQEDHFRRTGPECHASLTKELTVLRLHIEICKLDALLLGHVAPRYPRCEG